MTETKRNEIRNHAAALDEMLIDLNMINEGNTKKDKNLIERGKSEWNKQEIIEVRGQCGSGKSFLLIVEMIIRSISYFCKNGKVYKGMYLVCPYNAVRECQRDALKIVWSWMKNPKSDWYLKFNLKKYENLISRIKPNDESEFLKQLSFNIINPEKMWHIIFENQKVWFDEKGELHVDCAIKSGLHKIVLDEYHVDNNFYRAFLILYSTLISKAHTSLKLVLSSGTPILEVLNGKLINLESNLDRKINKYSMQTYQRSINGKKVYYFALEDEKQNSTKLNDLLSHVKEGEKVLIISRSKNINNDVKELENRVMNALNLKSNNVQLINSDNKVSIDKLNNDHEKRILIASPGTVSQGPTIIGLRLVINLNCFPELPKTLASNKSNIGELSWYANSDETNEQIIGRMGRLPDIDNQYYVITAKVPFPKKQVYLDILNALFVLFDHTDVDVEKLIEYLVTPNNLKIIFNGDFEWVEKTKRKMLKIINLHKDWIFGKNEANKFSLSKYTIKSKDHITEHDLAQRIIKAYLNYKIDEEKVKDPLYRNIDMVFKIVENKIKLKEYIDEIDYMTYYNEIEKLIGQTFEERIKELVKTACKNTINTITLEPPDVEKMLRMLF